MGIQLQALELENFGPITNQTFKFLPGATGIYGHNGKGKSHVVMAIRWLLTGSLPKMLGWYLGGYGLVDKKAKVTGTFLHNGQSLHVERSLHLKELGDLAKHQPPQVTSRASLEYGERKIKSVTEVTDTLLELTDFGNIRKQDVVFVLQNEGNKFLEAKEAERLRLFQYLSGAEVCERAVKAASNLLLGLAVVDRQPEIDEKIIRYDGLENGLSIKRNEVNIFEKQLAGLDVDTARKTVNLFEAAEQQAAISKELKEKHDKLAVELNAARADFHGTAIHIADLERQQLGMGLIYSNSVKILAEWDKTGPIRAQRQRLEQSLKTIHGSKKDIIIPTVSKEELAVLKNKERDTTGTSSISEYFLHGFRKNGKCPVCNTTPEQPKAMIKKHEEILITCSCLDEIRTRITRAETDWRDWEVAIVKEKARAEHEDALLEQLAGIPTTEQEGALGRTAMLATKEIEVYNGLGENLQQVKEKQQNIRIKGEALKAAYDACTGELGRRAAEVPNVTLADYTSAKLTISAREELLPKKLKLEGEIKAGEEELARLVADIQQVKEEQQKTGKKMQAIKLLEGVKTAFHHTAIPRARTVRYMTSINTLLARYCEQLHAPFSVFIEPERLDFMVRLSDNWVIPASQLSMGQQMIASIALRLALYEKHGAGIGFIVFDEPTAPLDEINVRCVGEIIQQLNAYCLGAGIQFIVVTHSAQLMNSFANTIKLE